MVYNDKYSSTKGTRKMIRECNHKDLKAIISLPDNFDENKKYPLVIFLHGAGTRGDDIGTLMRNVAFADIKNHQYKGYILAAPLCNAHDWCQIMQTVINWVSELRELTYVDTDRVYLTGLSMGGYGTWELTSIHPEWFAAIMPLCGGGCAGFAERLKNVPVRAFHGLMDKTVDPIESLQMVKAVNRRGGYAELILFPHAEHNCWSEVYTTEENYDWLLSHTLSSEEAPKEISGEIYG